MSFGFPIPRDRKSRVTRREGDSATRGARFRLVSNNDDVQVNLCSDRRKRPDNFSARGTVLTGAATIERGETSILKFCAREQGRGRNAFLIPAARRGVLSEPLIPYLRVSTSACCLYIGYGSAFSRSLLSETRSSAFEQSFVAGPSANTRQTANPRRDVPRVLDVYLTTGKSCIEQNRRRGEKTVAMKKDLEATKSIVLYLYSRPEEVTTLPIYRSISQQSEI
ncbi:Uncharacterized protein DBV15_10099 [Temnothorax longispinosus]|uniref:Uncharacterized protein n=1 Tax=Temnothorax longispinosus TaxID=300112 RepID=A0A4S2J9L1_9HYME|nr:Uncharacterized protein DBV15_10099 [Temnothorax longispinosus]